MPHLPDFLTWSAIFLAGGLTALLFFLWYRFHGRVEPGYREIHIGQARAPGGPPGNFRLYRYPGSASPRRVILLCHGLMANHLSFDLGKDLGGLAPYLRDAGWDVWVLELRGRLATRPTPFSPERYNWTISDYIFGDAVAALDLARKQTGARNLIWLGHSMGGLIGASLMASGADRGKIRRLVTLGSPLDFEKMKSLRTVARLYLALYPGRYVPARIPLKLLAPFMAPFHHRSISFLANTAHFTTREQYLILARVLGNLSTPLLKDFCRFLVAGEFRLKVPGESREIVFPRDLEKLKKPALFIAGGRDGLIPPPVVWSAWKNYGSQALPEGSPRKKKATAGPARKKRRTAARVQKEFLLLSEEQGFSGDFGHGDMLISGRAAKEVFPRILAFLK